MPETATDPLSAAFAALADPTRRAILARLAQGETSVGELVKPFPISGPAISRHLRVLENARLIERKVDARWRICRLHPPGLRVADDWLSQYRDFWESRLDRLVEVLEQGTAPDEPQASPSAPPETNSRLSTPQGPGTTHPRPLARPLARPLGRPTRSTPRKRKSP